ncbi:hypothetical protein [Endozoicomonas sp. 4G]|uniref:hypothetical protein n=1 Tax=Endozoicomonas sp. 4G TaxID=2872754 RepID=UPI0020790478|nr:hypothetical protein [Endozoicomonas sp. 4G]
MTLDSITLPDDLLWINEFDWNPVAQSQDRTLTGGLLIQEQSKKLGRPIELSGGLDAGWVNRSTVVELQSLSELANKRMILKLPDGRQFTVIFDRTHGSPIEAKQVLPFAYPDDNHFYQLTLRLLVVQGT